MIFQLNIMGSYNLISQYHCWINRTSCYEPLYISVGRHAIDNLIQSIMGSQLYNDYYRHFTEFY